jgi:hypothetical protein
VAERRYIIEDNESRKPNIFVVYTNWISYLDNFPRDNFIVLIVPPNVEKMDLVVFSIIFDWFIQIV